MIKILLILLFLGFTNLVLSQQESKQATTDSLTTSFGFGELYSNSTTTYPIGNDLQIELRKFYQGNLISERLRIPVVLKKYITDKTYILGGVQTEFEILPNGVINSRGDVLFGAGHKPNKNFSIESILQLPVINNKNVTPLGAVRPGSIFLNFGSKFKL